MEKLKHEAGAVNSIFSFINYICHLVLVKWDISPKYKTLKLCDAVGYDPIPDHKTLSFLKLNLKYEFGQHDHVELDLSGTNFGLSSAFLTKVILEILKDEEYAEKYYLGQLVFLDDSNGMYVSYINNKMSERV